MSWEPGNWRARSNRIGRIVGRPIKCDLVGRSQWRSILRLGAHPIFYWKQLLAVDLAVDLAVYFSRFCADFISKCLIIETVYLSKFWLKVVIVFSQFFASKYALRTATDYLLPFIDQLLIFFTSHEMIGWLLSSLPFHLIRFFVAYQLFYCPALVTFLFVFMDEVFLLLLLVS